MKRRSIARIIACGAVLAACSGMGLPQAEAQAHTPARLAAANSTSGNSAGYELGARTGPASAGDKFKVPTLTCPPTGTYAIELGAFLFSTSGPTDAEVTAECSSGTASYTGVLANNGSTTTTPFTPAAGDLMQAQASESATTTSAGLVDLTQRLGATAGSTVGTTSFSILDGMYGVSSSSSGTRPPPPPLPVPPFGRSRFTAGTIDGGTVSASGAGAYNMRTITGVLQIHTGALNSTGKAWTEGFRHS